MGEAEEVKAHTSPLGIYENSNLSKKTFLLRQDSCRYALSWFISHLPCLCFAFTSCRFSPLNFLHRHYAPVNNTKRKVFSSFERRECALCPSRMLWLFKYQMITAVLNNSFFLFLNFKSSRSFDSASQNIHTSLTRWVADWKSCRDIGYQQISMLADHQYTFHCLFFPSNKTINLLLFEGACMVQDYHAWFLLSVILVGRVQIMNNSDNNTF